MRASRRVGGRTASATRGAHVSGRVGDAQRPSLAERLHRSALGPAVRSLVSVVSTPLWAARGRPAPAPPHVKRSIVLRHLRAGGCRVFVETGTYRGDTLAAAAGAVDRAISIELDPTLAECARRRFRSVRHVEIVTGDSAVRLPEVVRSLDVPALFWLDGHFSGGATAESEVPVLAELQCILRAPLAHQVLIDDLRLFDGRGGYPTVEALRARVHELRPGWQFTVADDIAVVRAPGA